MRRSPRVIAPPIKNEGDGGSSHWPGISRSNAAAEAAAIAMSSSRVFESANAWPSPEIVVSHRPVNQVQCHSGCQHGRGGRSHNLNGGE